MIEYIIISGTGAPLTEPLARLSDAEELLAETAYRAATDSKYAGAAIFTREVTTVTHATEWTPHTVDEEIPVHALTEAEDAATIVKQVGVARRPRS